MSLSSFVKISNISNLSDARYCAGMQVNILGFNIDPGSEDAVSQSDFEEITEWVAGVDFAGECHTSDLDGIKSAVKNYPLSYLEISDIDLVEQVGLLGLKVIFRLSIETEEDLKGLSSTFTYLDELVSHVILKCPNATLHNLLDEQLSFYNGNLTLLKGYGVTANQEIRSYKGLEMEATKEEKPGFKDYGEIMDVLEILDEN